METKPKNTAGKFKVAIAVCGVVVFFIASIFVGSQARHSQISGEPMPNGKGGFMSSGDGYLIALVLLLFSLAWFLFARKSWQEK